MSGSLLAQVSSLRASSWGGWHWSTRHQWHKEFRESSGARRTGDKHTVGDADPHLYPSRHPPTAFFHGSPGPAGRL